MGERRVPRRRLGRGRGLDRGRRLARGRWRRLRGRRRVIPLRLGSGCDRRRGDRVGDAASGGSSFGSGHSDGASLGDGDSERPLSRVAPFPSKHASRADGSRSHSFLTILIITQRRFRPGQRRNRYGTLCLTGATIQSLPGPNFPFFYLLVPYSNDLSVSVY